MNVLSIQSWVAYGHVGNASAVFPLQRLGVEVWAVNTVQFSNHPGYGAWTGQVFGGAEIRAIIDGIEQRGALPRCDAVLSGYLGSTEVGEVVVDTVRRVRRANPKAIYCCDPVIGDDGPGRYVGPGVAELLAERALPLADIITPNRFELGQLTGWEAATLAEVKEAVAAVQRRMRPDGLGAVLLTSLRTEETPADAIDLLAAEAGAFHRLRTPRLALAANGAGDALAALFTVHRLRTGSTAAALEAACSSLFGVLRRTAEAGSRELLTVAAQEEFVSPSTRFSCEPC